MQSSVALDLVRTGVISSYFSLSPSSLGGASCGRARKQQKNKPADVVTHLIHLCRRKALLGLKIIIVPVHQPRDFASLSPSTGHALGSSTWRATAWVSGLSLHSTSFQEDPLSSLSSPPLQKMRSWCLSLLSFYFLFAFRRQSQLSEGADFHFFFPARFKDLHSESLCVLICL